MSVNYNLSTDNLQVKSELNHNPYTQKGKELVIERAKDIKSPILINTMALPVLPENKQPKKLV